MQGVAKVSLAPRLRVAKRARFASDAFAIL
jgi:hypothetical protein